MHRYKPCSAVTDLLGSRLLYMNFCTAVILETSIVKWRTPCHTYIIPPQCTPLDWAAKQNTTINEKQSIFPCHTIRRNPTALSEWFCKLPLILKWHTARAVSRQPICALLYFLCSHTIAWESLELVYTFQASKERPYTNWLSSLFNLHLDHTYSPIQLPQYLQISPELY